MSQLYEEDWNVVRRYFCATLRHLELNKTFNEPLHFEKWSFSIIRNCMHATFTVFSKFMHVRIQLSYRFQTWDTDSCYIQERNKKRSNSYFRYQKVNFFDNFMYYKNHHIYVFLKHWFPGQQGKIFKLSISITK